MKQPDLSRAEHLPASDAGQPQDVDLRVLVVAVLTGISGMLPFFLVGALAVQIRSDLTMSNGALGLMTSAFFVTSALTSRRIGARVDVIGWPRGIVRSAASSAVSLAVIAMLGFSPLTVLVGLAVGGLAQAWSIPASNLVIMSEMPTHRRGLTFGIKQVSGPATTLLGGLAVPAIALTVGWRWAFVAALVVPLGALVLARVTPASAPLPRTVPASTLNRGAPRRVPRLGLLAVGGALGAMVVGSLSAFAVLSAVEAGLSEAQGGLLLAMASAIGVLMRVTAGWWVDRFDSDGFTPVSTLLLFGGIGFVLLATREPTLIVPGTILAFVTGWGWPGLMHYAVSRANPTETGRATGVVQIGTSAGMALGPATFGLLVDRVGYGVGWTAVAGLSLTASLLVHVAASTTASDPGCGG